MTTKTYSRPLRTQGNEKAVRKPYALSAKATSEMSAQMRDPSTPLACQGADPELFFPTNHEDRLVAVGICARCPVRIDCLAFARSNKETGVWGGQLVARGKDTDELFKVELGPMRDRAAQSVRKSA